MMDGEQIFPDGHHPMATYRNIAANAYAKILLRRDVASSNPVTYYFIDFEGTLQYRPEEKPLAGGRRALESDVPEYAFWRLFDPFPVDVYTLGMVYRKRLLDVRESPSSPHEQRTSETFLEISESRISKTSYLGDD
jgi:hypothetical protein